MSWVVPHAFVHNLQIKEIKLMDEMKCASTRLLCSSARVLTYRKNKGNNLKHERYMPIFS